MNMNKMHFQNIEKPIPAIIKVFPNNNIVLFGYCMSTKSSMHYAFAIFTRSKTICVDVYNDVQFSFVYISHMRIKC